MSPWELETFTNFPQIAGEDGVAMEAFGLVDFAGVDVGLACIAGGVD